MSTKEMSMKEMSAVGRKEMGTITVAEHAGYCYGVKRAVKMAEDAAEKNKKTVYTLGDIIHNKNVIDKLAQKGILSVKDVNSVPDGSDVVIRAHGVGLNIYDELKKKNCNIIDATCPNVGKIHEIVREQSEQGRHIIIIGNGNHPETIGTSGWCTSDPTVIENEQDLNYFAENAGIMKDMGISVVAQTTMNKDFYDFAVEFLKKTCKGVRFFDTICSATAIRQKEVRDLALKCDLMIVIGDKSSANSRHLAEICMDLSPKVLFVENAGEIDISSIDEYRHIGIAAGASVPEWVIKEVVTRCARK